MSIHADTSRWWDPFDLRDLFSDDDDLPTDVGIRKTGTSRDDVLIGTSRADRIDAGAGDDLIDGRRGADTMTGGRGDDRYLVDDRGDRVVETAGGGSDTVVSSVSLKLGTAIENLTLTGTKSLSATGNLSDNRLTGNLGDNALSGGAGDDTLFGASGRDTLSGGAGDDRLVGGLGKDLLTGGRGADTFAFATTVESRPTAGDVVTDFDGARGDRIDLSAIDANLRNGIRSNDAFTYIGTEAFHGVAGELRHETRGGATIVSADVNGDGRADMILTLSDTTDLSRDVFLL